MKRILLLTAATVVLACCGRGGGLPLEPWDAYRNPVLKDPVEDPSVLSSGGKFYVYYSGSGEEDVIPILESEDLVAWNPLSPAFSAITAPAPVDGAVIRSCCVIPFGGKLYLYYTAIGTTETAVGLATAEFPTGPWTDEGMVVKSVAAGTVLTGHPSAYEKDGVLHLVLQTDKGIYSQALSADGKAPSGAPVKIASEAFSAPALFKYGGRWYLLATTGSTEGEASSTARIVYGRSDSDEGPFTDRAGGVMLDGAAEVLLSGGKKFAGPGHCSAPLEVGGAMWLVYNAYDLADVSRGRTLMLDPLMWEDGWMKVRGGICSFCSDKPVVSR